MIRNSAGCGRYGAQIAEVNDHLDTLGNAYAPYHSKRKELEQPPIDVGVHVKVFDRWHVL